MLKKELKNSVNPTDYLKKLRKRDTLLGEYIETNCLRIAMMTEILNNLCYTELVYGRINKKLNTAYSKQEIERFIKLAIRETDESSFEQIGKNIYITNVDKHIRITVNSHTYRVITVDKIKE